MRYELADGFDALHEDWGELAEASGNVFATLEFTRLWWRHFGGGRRLLLIRCRDAGGGLVAVFPLYLWRRLPLRVVRFLGNGAGDVLGPICASDRRDDAARALRGMLDAAPWGWDVFVGENLPGHERWSERLDGSVVRREGSPALRLTGGFDDYLARRSANFRRQVRARERRLQRRYDVRYRLADGSTLDADFDALLALHANRWAEDSAFAGHRTHFHRAFARRAARRGWLRFWLLELDGRPAAAEYGFRFGGTECFYQSGRDPAYERESLGMAILAHAVRAGAEDGVREFAFLRGQEQYKYRFATHDGGSECVCVVRGRAAATAFAALRVLQSSSAARKALRGPLDM